jgi:hypothetical protein
MWECSETLCDELLGPIERFPEATASKTHFSAVRSMTLPVPSIAAQLWFVQNWERLVRHYRASLLTERKDRIMAFAGIAQAVHNSSRMTYLAGSWEQIFPFSFMWNVGCIQSEAITSDSSTITEVEAAVEAVPSWSWFSVPIFSNDAFKFEVVDKMLHGAHPLDSSGIASMYQATLLSVEDTSQQAYGDFSTSKAFHDFVGMTLKLAIKTWTGFLENSQAPSSQYVLSIRDQLARLLGPYYGRLECQFDHQDRVHSDKIVTFGLLIELRTGHMPEWQGGLGEPFLIGLLMQREPRREAYVRIGLWTLYLNGHEPEWNSNRFDSVSIFDQLEGVRSEHIRLA